MMSHFFSRSTNTCLPSGVFMFTVIERLLQLSIVKYRLSAFGTSRSWPRVASPCGGSSLITSAPIHARSCEHVGPACTWVMSNTRTSFNAFISVSCNPPSAPRGEGRLFNAPSPRLRGQSWVRGFTAKRTDILGAHDYQE